AFEFRFADRQLDREGTAVTVPRRCNSANADERPGPCRRATRPGQATIWPRCGCQSLRDPPVKPRSSAFGLVQRAPACGTDLALDLLTGRGRLPQRAGLASLARFRDRLIARLLLRKLFLGSS